MAPEATEAEREHVQIHAVQDRPADEGLVRLKERLDVELGAAAGMLADAEQTVAELDAALRPYEVMERPRMRVELKPALDRATSWIKGIPGACKRKVEQGVRKSLALVGKDGASASDTAPPAPPATDLLQRLEGVLGTIAELVRQREQQMGDVERRLAAARQDLVRRRADEQHARDTQIRIGQTRQLCEDLERKMAQLDDVIRQIEEKRKGDTAARLKRRDAGEIPSLERRMQEAIDVAVRAVAEQERAVAELEKERDKLQQELVHHRTREQHLRQMHARLRTAKHLSDDLRRGLGAVSGTIEDLRRRAEGLFRSATPDSSAAAASSRPTRSAGP